MLFRSKEKATLNYVEIIPSSSPSSSETELTVHVKVVTRAQAKAREGLRGEESKSKRSLRVERNQRYRRNKQRRKFEMRKPKTQTSGELEFQELQRKLPEEPKIEDPQPIGDQARSAVESGGLVS